MSTNRSERLKNLSPQKRAILLKALGKETVQAEQSKRIPRRSQQNYAPLSFAQQRLWFLDRLSPENPAYNLRAAVLLQGQLNLSALQQTLNEIVRRHEVLRTTFAESDSLCRLLAGCVQLGCAADGDKLMKVAPVDYVSRSLVHLSRQKESSGKKFHLVNPHSFYLSELVAWIRSIGYPIERVWYETWQAELVNRAGNSLDRALYPLVGLFSEKVSEAEMPLSGTRHFDCQNTLDGLAKLRRS